jgi:PTS system mannose-specific IID component/fructoselysine and glucoselysine-specific PTS system IID component
MWNFERQMNTAFMWGMSNTIDRIYNTPEEDAKRKQAYKRHLQFFNITPQFGSFVLGLSAAMEEEYATDPDGLDPKMINAVKVALMGPLSGIGDSLFQGTIRLIAMSIGISFAQQGSILGPVLAMIISFGTSFPITWYGGKLGYLNGQKYLQQISKSNLMDKVMYGCSIAGLMVIGGMVASLVDVTTPLAFGKAFKLQVVLDGIFPKMIPLALTGIMFYFVKKGAKPMVVILSCFIVGIVLNYFKILAI